MSELINECSASERQTPRPSFPERRPRRRARDRRWRRGRQVGCALGTTWCASPAGRGSRWRGRRPTGTDPESGERRSEGGTSLRYSGVTVKPPPFLAEFQPPLIILYRQTSCVNIEAAAWFDLKRNSPNLVIELKVSGIECILSNLINLQSNSKSHRKLIGSKICLKIL